MSDERKTTGIELSFNLAMIVPIIMMNGFALSTLWLWFLVPLGVIPIGIAHACGLTTLFSLFLLSKSDYDNKDNSPCVPILRAFFAPLVAWGFGAIYHWFMIKDISIEEVSSVFENFLGLFV